MSAGIQTPEMTSPDRIAADPTADEEVTLFAWMTHHCGGPIRNGVRTAGGNRARSWSIDVETPQGLRAVFPRHAPRHPPSVERYTAHRQAPMYRAIAPIAIRAPKLIAEPPHIQAILTDCGHGIAELAIWRIVVTPWRTWLGFPCTA